VSKRLSNRQYFYLVIIDEDIHAFSVVGPMTDDTKLTDAVCEAQERGRHVRCFTTSDPSSGMNWGKERGLTLRESIALRAGDLG
jgi:hypothetical protein